MFNFMKKDKEHKDKKEKDERKKEKKDKKDKEKKAKEREPMTQDDLNRLDEVKKGVFRRFSERDRTKKSGSVKGATSPDGVPRDSSDSSLSSGRPSPVREMPPADRKFDIRDINKPERVPSKGSADRPKPSPKPRSILKPKNSGPIAEDIDSSIILKENTRINQLTAHIVNNGNEQTYENVPVQEPPKEPEKSYKSRLRLPSIVPPQPPRIRELILQRQPAGDFGFTLRKAVLVDKGGGDNQETRHTVIFAEPGSGVRNLQTGLIPGDKLIEVNDVNVEDTSREEIVELIRSSGSSLSVKVQPIQELIELSVRPAPDGGTIEVQDEVIKGGTLKRSGSFRHKKGARSETEVQSEKAWLEAEKVWLVHKGGFASACVLRANGMSPLPEGRVRIKLDHGGDILEVDEDDVEKANPPQFDRAEDLASLRYLNESSALHSFRQRYGGNLIHTYAGKCMIVVNPMHPMAIYSEKVIQVFRGCKQEDMPPHIYATGQIAYREMLNSRNDQSIVFMGRSGSGKTTNERHVLHYLVASAGSVNNILTVDKLHAVSTLLEAFGNSRTILNTNASRYSQLTTLDFDHSGQITSGSVQIFLFEKTRVVRRPEGEPSFHVFYQMLAGIDSTLRNELHLNSLNEPNLFMTPLQRSEDRQRASSAWAKIYNAMDLVGVSDEERKALCFVLAAIYHLGVAGAVWGMCLTLCFVLAAIYHLGVAGAVRGQNNKPQFARPAAAQKAAALLGLPVEELSRQIFSSAGSGTLTRNTSVRNSPADKGANEAHQSAMDALEGFVIGLYSDVFNALVSLINRSLSSTYRTTASITLVDTPGFQNPTTCGRQSGATFEDLCHNYTQERLQLLFHDLTFTIQQDRYSQENIDCDFEFVTTSPAAMVSLIDRQAQQLLKMNWRTSSQDLKDADKKGLLWILDEEAIFPGATEDSFMDRFFKNHGEQKVRRDSLLRKASSIGNTFILNHYQGTNPVQYNASGWLKVCRENPQIKVATQVLQDSKKQSINQLFNNVKAPVAGMVSGSIVGMEGTTSLRRVGSMRRTFMSGTAGIKKRSLCLQVKFQVDSIIETIRKTNCHFVHNVLPQHNAGLWELKPLPSPTDKPGTAEEILMNVPLVRSQIRGSEVLDSVRIYRQGFPDSMRMLEFRHRFEGLLNPTSRPAPDMEEKLAVNTILDHLEIEKLNYRVGLSQVFFRAGALNQLEAARDEKITGTVIGLQACCRGYLGRKYLGKLRVKHIAISCIQKNIRKLMLIRDWPWWRLYTKVKPLLDVHRTEEELKSREYELEQMKSKLERIERERNEYKQQSEKLENRLAEATADLAEEHSAAIQSSEMLDAETSERMRLEKDLKDLQSKYTVLKRHGEKIEMELTQVHLWQAQSLDGEMDGEDMDGDNSIYKERYERILRELNFTKKRMSKEHEDEMELEQNARKALEKRIHEAIEDGEDLRRQLTAAKKKSSRLATEMQDIKLHLEEQITRNNELERKQRRFDTELSKASDESKDERISREKLQREKDQLTTELYTKDQEIERLKLDLESQTDKASRLDRELLDMSLTSTKGTDKEVMSLKKSKHEMEIKLKDQEEELDDQAGQIQQLEQTKTRLEMNLERLRQTHIKELEEKEEEMQENRYATQKKLKHMESQMEEEYEDKKRMQTEKRDIERQLQEINASKLHQDKDGEKRVRLELRKTKALLRDAETVLQKMRGSEGTKTIIKQLRNRLEDSEFAAATAVKAKKTMELEIQDLQQQLDDLFKTKTEGDNKAMVLMREKSDLQSQLEENEEDMNDVMKKYKAIVHQQSVDQVTVSDQLQQIDELSTEREKLRLEVAELQMKVQGFEDTSVDKNTVQRLESKIRDLENRLDLEQTAKHRVEVQLTRTKEAFDKSLEEKRLATTSKQQIDENLKRTQRQLRDQREEFSDAQKRELESSQKSKELENKVSELESDHEQNQSDLKLAFKRIADLQAALEEDLDSGDSLLGSDDDEDSDADSDLDSMYLTNHRPPSLIRHHGLGSPRSSSHSAASSLGSPRSPSVSESSSHA
ncbi:unconventional myosin-XVIIIa-like isoform X3 [Mizuhopecten yessoensis]|uniref:unconventional myosin-XVIIIa-like isoform X3 n=1 Tax=Mizuhopecten yessoensis TaxID=6573 RepID=UPI000B45D759|nr:unconventional myosin-XVIIIa-like isoform X3 [Mizuhopecten yessoensis]